MNFKLPLKCVYCRSKDVKYNLVKKKYDCFRCGKSFNRNKDLNDY